MTKKEVYKALKEDILKNGDAEFKSIPIGSNHELKLLDITRPFVVTSDLDEAQKKSSKKNLNKVKDDKKAI